MVELTSGKKIRIAFFCRDNNGACPVIRVISPLEKLKKNAEIELEICLVDNFTSENIISWVKAANKSDIIIFQRAFMVDFIKKIVKNHKDKIIIYELDDNLIKLPPEHPLYDNYVKNKDKVVEMLSFVDAITLPTEFLKKELLKFNKNIYVLPNYLDSNIWSKKLIKKQKKDFLYIGYSGSFTHAADLELIVPLLERIKEKFGDKVKFKFLGCKPKNLKTVDFEYEAENFSYNDFAYKLINCEFDIALAPLQINDFNKSKSNIKYLEYSISKIPAVYTDIEPYSSCIKNGFNGFLVKNSVQKWDEAVSKLIEDSCLRVKLAKNAFVDVQKKYMLEDNCNKWLKLYSRILSNKNP